MRAAIYARVSTEGQQACGTIGSQVAELRERVAKMTERMEAGSRPKATSASRSSATTVTPGGGWTGPAWTCSATPPRLG